MRWHQFLLGVVVFSATTVAMSVGAPAAHANAKGVGLGVAGGAAYSWTALKEHEIKRDVGSSFAWGFFVDIPLAETFYISPAAMLYEHDFGSGREPVTDIDLNFKFIVPLGFGKLGAGFTTGLTNSHATRSAHWGGLGYLAFNLVSNVDLFVLAQYKILAREAGKVEDLHAYSGLMFHF